MDNANFQAKARQNLIVAEWCYQNGHYDACCNRAYYAMFHAAIAALKSEGIFPAMENMSHPSVQSQFVSHFCNKKKIFPKFRSYLQEAQKRRNIADYKPDLMRQNRANQQLNWAKEFVQAILARLDQQL